MTMATHYRQGDVLLIRVDNLPAGSLPEEATGARVVLAYGEVTGHAHALDAMLSRLHTCGSDRYLVALPGAKLVHEEHGAIELPEGVYRVVRQREYSPIEIRPVCD